MTWELVREERAVKEGYCLVRRVKKESQLRRLSRPINNKKNQMPMSETIQGPGVEAFCALHPQPSPLVGSSVLVVCGSRLGGKQ